MSTERNETETSAETDDDADVAGAATDIAMSKSLADLAARIGGEHEAPSGRCSGYPPSSSKLHVG